VLCVVDYCAPQEQLLGASEVLLNSSSDVQSLLRVLLHYQHAAARMSHSIMAQQMGARDLLFYAAAVAVPLLLNVHADIRLGLLLLVAALYGLESNLLSMLAEGLQLLQAPWGAVPAAAALPAPPHALQQAKWLLRLAALVAAVMFIRWRLWVHGEPQRRLEQQVAELHAYLLARYNALEAVPTHHTAQVRGAHSAWCTRFGWQQEGWVLTWASNVDQM
jgi:hypothetical protein